MRVEVVVLVAAAACGPAGKPSSDPSRAAQEPQPIEEASPDARAPLDRPQEKCDEKAAVDPKRAHVCVEACLDGAQDACAALATARDDSELPGVLPLDDGLLVVSHIAVPRGPVPKKGEQAARALAVRMRLVAPSESQDAGEPEERPGAHCSDMRLHFAIGARSFEATCMGVRVVGTNALALALPRVEDEDEDEDEDDDLMLQAGVSVEVFFGVLLGARDAEFVLWGHTPVRVVLPPETTSK